MRFSGAVPNAEQNRIELGEQISCYHEKNCFRKFQKKSYEKNIPTQLSDYIYFLLKNAFFRPDQVHIGTQYVA